MTNEGPGGDRGRRNRNATGAKRSNGERHPPSPRTVWMRAVAFSDLPSTRRTVAWAIGQRMNGSLDASPSLALIAKDSGLDVSTVKRSVVELRAAGLLVNATGGGRGRSNVYTGTIPASIWPKLDAETGAHRAGFYGETGVHDPETGAQDTSKQAHGAPRSSSEVDKEGAAAPFVDDEPPPGPAPWVPLGMTWREYARSLREHPDGRP